MSDITYTGTYQIRTYEIDQRKKVTIPALLQLMQEASMQNVIALKLSVWDMEPLALAWVARRMWLRIDALPELGDTVTITTYPANSEGIYTYRDYLLSDALGNTLATCSSKWILFDTRKRSLRQIPPDLFYFEMPDPGTCLERPSGKVRRLASPAYRKRFALQWHDLDFNGHLNNVAYVRLMLEAIPEEILESSQLKELDIVFRAEAQWPGEILSLCENPEPNVFLHSLSNHADAEFAAARTAWQSFPE